jgi:hypothetical protein
MAGFQLKIRLLRQALLSSPGESNIRLNSLTVAVCDDLLTNPRNLTAKSFDLLNNSKRLLTLQLVKPGALRAMKLCVKSHGTALARVRWKFSDEARIRKFGRSLFELLGLTLGLSPLYSLLSFVLYIIPHN